MLQVLTIPDTPNDEELLIKSQSEHGEDGDNGEPKKINIHPEEFPSLANQWKFGQMLYQKEKHCLTNPRSIFHPPLTLALLCRGMNYCINLKMFVTFTELANAGLAKNARKSTPNFVKNSSVLDQFNQIQKAVILQMPVKGHFSMMPYTFGTKLH